LVEGIAIDFGDWHHELRGRDRHADVHRLGGSATTLAGG